MCPYAAGLLIKLLVVDHWAGRGRRACVEVLVYMLVRPSVGNRYVRLPPLTLFWRRKRALYAEGVPEGVRHESLTAGWVVARTGQHVGFDD